MYNRSTNERHVHSAARRSLCDERKLIVKLPETRRLCEMPDGWPTWLLRQGEGDTEELTVEKVEI
jgi:hypothetical protein